MKFSIIMPTFDREHCIHRTLHSISEQIHKDWELIIVDSKPSNYHFNDDKIKYLTKIRTKSAAAQRNIGIPLATGDIIIFFDDDDVMDTNYLSIINNTFIENAKCKMVIVKMDANHDKPRLKYATPCCAIKKDYVTSTWQSTDQLQDQRYYKEIVRKNKWRYGNDILEIDKVLVFVGHSPNGGLRSPLANF